MKQCISTGVIKIDDNCDVITVLNYSATAIEDMAAVIHDPTNIDVTQGLLAVKTTTSADSDAVAGVAKGAIPGAVTDGMGMVTPGVGQMVVHGLCKVRCAYGSTFAVGAYLGTSSVAAEAATGTPAFGSHLGKVAIAKSLTTATYNWVYAWICLA
jgi:hypothetical protein